jgi:hypothetical protein
LPPSQACILDGLVELLSDSVKACFKFGNCRRLLPQHRQFIPANREQHARKATFINRRIRNADVVSHELGDYEICLKQASERQRVNPRWSQHCQSCRAYRTILMRPDDSHSPALWSNRRNQNIARLHKFSCPAWCGGRFDAVGIDNTRLRIYVRDFDVVELFVSPAAWVGALVHKLRNI